MFELHRSWGVNSMLLLFEGWRLGWITIHDANGLFEKGGLCRGLQSLSQRTIGANTLVQGALPAILNNTPESFFEVVNVSQL